MNGLLISFEGPAGCGKSTQVTILADRLKARGRTVHLVREPGGTPIGEEIRFTLKHSPENHAMTWEAELLLMNASRAQLVREIIRPALAAGEVVICDRYYDSTTAYQGYGRGLDLALVKAIIDFAIGETRPDLTLFLELPLSVSEARLASRQATMPFVRDRMEEADRAFFERVARGYRAIANAEPGRIKVIDAAASLGTVSAAIWRQIECLIGPANS